MTVRFGLIGCGQIGQLRASALGQLRSGRLTAVSDVRLESARELAEKYRTAVHADWQSLIKSETVDAVIVSTPPSMHAQMCTEALEAGKHVLCEKPLALTPAEGRRMLESAERSGCFLATGFNFRFYPSFQKARELLDAGVIGNLAHVRSYAGYSAAEQTQAWLRSPEVVGGGALRDNGIHLIDLTRYFLGEVAEVRGFSSSSVWELPGCEDNGFMVLRSPSGQLGSLQASWTEWRGYRFMVELVGTHGYIRASCFPMMAQVIRANKPGGRTRQNMHLFPMSNLMERVRSYRWIVTQSLVQELDAFTRAIRGEVTALATGADGLRALEIADQVACNSIGRSTAPWPT
ncbi:MAG: Gfo/Idh/MocA family protein [Chloroflexota bacterium]